MARLQGKVCIVTGASSGIGRAISLEYAKLGGTVVCADLNSQARPGIEGEAAINTHELIQQRGSKSLFVQTDVVDSQQVQKLVSETVAHFGRIDVYVHTVYLRLGNVG